MLPEYEINPHMRLANVVKGKLKYQGAMGQYEIDFVVCDKSTGEIICAIELDDYTHNTEDAKRRDRNKNTWLCEAQIPLVRLENINAAYKIKERMKTPFKFVGTRNKISKIPKEYQPLVLKTIGTMLTLIMLFGLWLTSKNYLENLGKNAIAKSEQLQKENQQHAKEQKEKMIRAQAAVSLPKPAIASPQPQFKQVVVKAKSAQECVKNKTITNESILCMRDHYETVQVSGNQ